MTGAAGRVAHAELRIGGSTIFLGDAHPHLEDIFAPPRIGGTPVYLSLETDDVAGLFERVITAGADAIRQPTDAELPIQTAKFRASSSPVTRRPGCGRRPLVWSLLELFMAAASVGVFFLELRHTLRNRQPA